MPPALTLTLALLASAIGTTPGCGGDNWPARPAAKAWRLTALTDMLQIKPGEVAAASFALTTLQGVPAPEERVDFSVIDDPQAPDNALAGATLGASFDLTDDAGVALVTVRAGLPTSFRLSARHQHPNPVEDPETTEVPVNVSEGDQGTIAVFAANVAGSAVAAVVTRVDVLLFEGLSCSDLSTTFPPDQNHPVKTVAIGSGAEFSVATASSTSAVIAQGRDAAGALRAAGCIDVPGTTIVAGNAVRVYVPLSEIEPTPRGTFALTSRFVLAKRPIAQRLAAPWQDLADCPLDPGQLWLDCTIDALGSPPGDPLDCVPAMSGEGALAELILARRAAAVTGSPCRGLTTAAGQPGLDAEIAALFPTSSTRTPLGAIASFGSSLMSILDALTLTSTLTLDETASPGLFQGSHALRTAAFVVGGKSTTVDIVAQGIAGAQTRFISVSTHSSTVSVDTHRLGLHLGTLAHVAFAQVALTGQGWPANTSGFLDLLFGLASTGTGASRKTGCDALDALVCGDVGRAAGCVAAACVAGQAALAARLDAAFDLVDGDGQDLQLSGFAAMSDDNQDGIADRLGSDADSGLWTAQIRAHAGTEIVSGSWTGKALAQ